MTVTAIATIVIKIAWAWPVIIFALFGVRVNLQTGNSLPFAGYLSIAIEKPLTPGEKLVRCHLYSYERPEATCKTWWDHVKQRHHWRLATKSAYKVTPDGMSMDTKTDDLIVSRDKVVGHVIAVCDFHLLFRSLTPNGRLLNWADLNLGLSEAPNTVIRLDKILWFLDVPLANSWYIVRPPQTIVMSGSTARLLFDQERRRVALIEEPGYTVRVFEILNNMLRPWATTTSLKNTLMTPALWRNHQFYFLGTDNCVWKLDRFGKTQLTDPNPKFGTLAVVANRIYAGTQLRPDQKNVDEWLLIPSSGSEAP